MNKLDIKSLLKPSILLIFSAILFSTLMDQYLTKQVESIISSKDGLSNMIWVWGGLSVLSAILFPLLTSLFCAYFLITSTKSLNEFVEDNFELSLIETLRAWGKTFLWSFVFLLPGVIKYINYILTPFVVMFSKKYKRGEVDALEYSTVISKTFFWSIKMWLGIFYVIVPVLFYALFDEYRIFSDHPFAATIVVGLETVVEIIFHFILLNLFIKFLNANEVENGSHV
ncbi:MAG: hypothetical protein ABL930_01815 [Pseudobdellovibrio sp.]